MARTPSRAHELTSRAFEGALFPADLSGTETSGVNHRTPNRRRVYPHRPRILEAWVNRVPFLACWLNLHSKIPLTAGRVWDIQTGPIATLNLAIARPPRRGAPQAALRCDKWGSSQLPPLAVKPFPNMWRAISVWRKAKCLRPQNMAIGQNPFFGARDGQCCI